MMNPTNNKNLLKLAICAILLLANIGNVISVIGTILSIVVSLLKSPIYVGLGLTLIIRLIAISTTIGVFIYFYKHLDYIFNEKSLNKQLLINIIIYPTVHLVNTGIAFLNTRIIAECYNTHFMAEYYVKQNIISIASSILNILILTSLSIFVLVKNPVIEINNETND